MERWNQLFSSKAYRDKLEELLIEKVKNEEMLLKASEEGDFEEVKRLIVSQKVNVNTVGECKSTPLINSAKKGHLEVVQFLVEFGANVNKADKYGFTPLNNAAQKDHTDIVIFLL